MKTMATRKDHACSCPECIRSGSAIQVALLVLTTALIVALVAMVALSAPAVEPDLEDDRECAEWRTVPVYGNSGALLNETPICVRWYAPAIN